jgi:hypothetical protein
MKRILLVATFIVAAAATNTSAHHSYANYNQDQILEISGVIEVIEWVNPHTLLKVRTPERLYTFEWVGAYGLNRRGITMDTLKVGDRVVAKGNPRRDIAESGIVHMKDIERAKDGWGWAACRGVRQGKETERRSPQSSQSAPSEK